MFERTKNTDPAGVSYRIRYFEPYPLFVKKSMGARLVDLDGNVYTDYSGTHMTVILGHSHPIVTEPIKRQAEKGWLSGLSQELEVAHAEAIAKHAPSAEMIRYCSSGSEVNSLAI